jgi:hypothetical protein
MMRESKRVATFAIALLSGGVIMTVDVIIQRIAGSARDVKA